jgi:hypothetical protein
MAEETSSTTSDQQLSQIIAQLLSGKTAQPAADPNMGPSSMEGRGLLSRIGEGLAGGAQYGSTQEREQGGLAALGAMGARMLQASDWSSQPHTFGSILGQGLESARGSLGQTQAVSAAQHYATQQLAHQQQQDQIARLREALPYLKLQEDRAAVARMKAADQPTNTDIGKAGTTTTSDVLPPTPELAPVVAPGGAKFQVAATVAEKFQGLVNDLEANGYRLDPATSGGYNKRFIAGTHTPSNHAFGTAIDINWAKNPQGGSASDIPPDLARKLAAKHGLVWGGDWSGKTRDPMHFEVPRPRADATPETGAVQAAGDAAPTSNVIPTLPPAAAAASAADVAQIEAGRAEARTSMASGPGQGTMVAGPPGTVPPAMPPTPEFKMRPLTPTEQAQTSYALSPDVERTLKVMSVGARTPEDVVKVQDARRAALMTQREKADAARLAIEKEARQDWLKQNSPATDAHLAASGMIREPGVQYLVDNAGNVTTKAIPVDARVAARAEAEGKRYLTDYAEPYDKIRPVHQLLDHMEALDKKIKSDSFGGRGTVGSNFAQSVQKTLSGLGLASQDITDATANQEAYNALHNQLVLKLKGLSGTSLGNTSNTDLAFLDTSAPAMNTTPEGRARTTAAIRQILNYQGRLYEIATDSLHDPNNHGTMRDLHERLAKEPPAIPTFPGKSISPADGKAWMEHNKPRRGTAYYNSKGDLAIWGVDPLE